VEPNSVIAIAVVHQRVRVVHPFSRGSGWDRPKPQFASAEEVAEALGGTDVRFIIRLDVAAAELDDDRGERPILLRYARGRFDAEVERYTAT
jgi:hypothetical protein